MHFWMASADRADDCLSRLSSEADFLHLQVIQTRLNCNLHIPSKVITWHVRHPPVLTCQLLGKAASLRCMARLTGKASHTAQCHTGKLWPSLRHRSVGSTARTAWGG